MPVYDFSNPDDIERFNREKPKRPNFGNPDEALAYALGLPSREERIDFARYVKKYYGRAAYDALVAGLKKIAAQKAREDKTT